jgi:hypothetical protein
MGRKLHAKTRIASVLLCVFARIIRRPPHSTGPLVALAHEPGRAAISREIE